MGNQQLCDAQLLRHVARWWVGEDDAKYERLGWEYWYDTQVVSLARVHSFELFTAFSVNFCTNLFDNGIYHNSRRCRLCLRILCGNVFRKIPYFEELGNGEYHDFLYTDK